MYLSPYSKHDDELTDLLAECLDDLNLSAQQDYLVNILTAPENKNKTVKEMLIAEVKAKHELEENLAKK